MVLAVFDIDGTLVQGPSTEKRLFGRLLRDGLLSPVQLGAFVWFAMRHAHAHGRHVFKKDKAYLTGLEVGRLESFTAAWVPRDLPADWFVPCLERLRQHQVAGDRVVLLSGTPDFVAAEIGRALGVEEAIGSRCRVRNGRFTSAPPLCHPFGLEKLRIVEGLCAEAGVRLADVTAYADSGHDLPLLRRVGRPVAVRPDGELLAAAQAAGWETLGHRRGEPGVPARARPAD